MPHHVAPSRALSHAKDDEFVAYDTKTVSRPTDTYLDLDRAYQFFNRELFGGKLPDCLITLQRKRGVYGYFAPERFANLTGNAEVVDEIALNPTLFEGRTPSDTLSVLVHEMVHLWQHHFGKPGRGRYHNREWARQMNFIGLGPSDNGKPGGKATGERVGHFIREGGPFDVMCGTFLAKNTTLLYQDVWYRPQKDDEAAERARSRKAATKTRYLCPACGLHAWAKAGVHIRHVDCDEDME